MTIPANVQPAPGTNPDMPTPAPAPEAAPAPELSNSPVNAESAASDAVQAAAAQAAAEAAPQPAPAPAPSPIIDTGNKTFDQVGQLLAGKHADVNRVLKEAASGDISMATKAELIEALGGDVANLAISQMEGEVARQRQAGEASAQAMKASIAEALGAPADQADQVWADITNFAMSPESGMSQEDVAAVNKMLASGGIVAEMAKNDLVARFQKSQGFTQSPNLLPGQGGMNAGFQPLSKVDYRDQIGPLVQKYGEGSREVEQLRNRRMQSIQRGF